MCLNKRNLGLNSTCRWPGVLLQTHTHTLSRAQQLESPSVHCIPVLTFRRDRMSISCFLSARQCEMCRSYPLICGPQFNEVDVMSLQVNHFKRSLASGQHLCTARGHDLQYCVTSLSPIMGLESSTTDLTPAQSSAGGTVPRRLAKCSTVGLGLLSTFLCPCGFLTCHWAGWRSPGRACCNNSNNSAVWEER